MTFKDRDLDYITPEIFLSAARKALRAVDPHIPYNRLEDGADSLAYELADVAREYAERNLR
jgi:hypothetical protein